MKPPAPVTDFPLMDPGRGSAPGANPKPKPKPKPPITDPLVAGVDAQFKPAFDALERQRLAAQADRDAGLRDRAAFDEWARADRERRLGVLRSEFGRTAAGLDEQRRLSDERLTSAIDAALGRLGGLGTGALSTAGFMDSVGGAKTGMDVASLLAAREGSRSGAMTERADAQSRIDRANADTMTARTQAQYGRRQASLDDARLGLEQQKSTAVGKAREAQAKAAEDAWMRDYLAGKQSDANALAQARLDVTQRGQDITADTAAADRASRESIAAARIEAQLAKASPTGYRGTTPEQYTKLRSDWYKRAVDALDPAKFEGDLTKVRATGQRQLDVLVGAGLRPRDAAMVIESASGGRALTESDYLAFFRKHLPSANAHRLMFELFGVPIPTGTDSFTSQSGAVNTKPRKAPVKKKAPPRKVKPRPVPTLQLGPGLLTGQ